MNKIGLCVQDLINHSMFNCQHKWGISMIFQKEKRIFTLKMNKVFILAP